MGGFNLKEKNIRLRFFSIVFMGILAFASVLYWRSKLLASQEYVPFESFEPGAKQSQAPASESVLRSQNYQIETSEAFPATE